MNFTIKLSDLDLLYLCETFQTYLISVTTLNGLSELKFGFYLRPLFLDQTLMQIQTQTWKVVQCLPLETCRQFTSYFRIINRKLYTEVLEPSFL